MRAAPSLASSSIKGQSGVSFLPASDRLPGIYEVFFGDKWLATRFATSARSAIQSVVRRLAHSDVQLAFKGLQACDLRAAVRDV